MSFFAALAVSTQCGAVFVQSTAANAQNNSCTFNEASCSCLDQNGTACLIPGTFGPCGHITTDEFQQFITGLAVDNDPAPEVVDKEKIKVLVKDFLANYSEMDLRGSKFEGTFPYANFRGANLQCVDFSDALLTGVDFGGADLRWANFAGANLVAAKFKAPAGQNTLISYANFSNARIAYADFSRVWAVSTNFANVMAQHVVFDDAYGILATFTNAWLQDANLRRANFAGASFVEADLSFADMREMTLQGFINGTLHEANFTSSRINYAVTCGTPWPATFFSLDATSTAGVQHRNLCRARELYLSKGAIYIPSDICAQYSPRSEVLFDFSSISREVALDRLSIDWPRLDIQGLYKAGYLFPAGRPGHPPNNEATECVYSSCPVWLLRSGEGLLAYTAPLITPGGTPIGSHEWPLARFHYPVRRVSKLTSPKTIAEAFFYDLAQVNLINSYEGGLSTLLRALPFGISALNIATAVHKGDTIFKPTIIADVLVDAGLALTIGIGIIPSLNVPAFWGAALASPNAMIRVVPGMRYSSAVLLASGVAVRSYHALEAVAGGDLQQAYADLFRIIFDSLIFGQNIRAILQHLGPPRPTNIFKPDQFVQPSAFANLVDRRYPKLAAAMANFTVNRLRIGRPVAEILEKLGDMRRGWQVVVRGSATGEFGLIFGAPRVSIAVNPIGSLNNTPVGLRREMILLADEAMGSELISYRKYRTISGSEVPSVQISTPERVAQALGIDPQAVAINMHMQVDTRFTENIWGNVPPILQDLSQRVGIFLNPTTTSSAALSEFSDITFAYYHAMPYQRGSDAIGRSFLSGLYYRKFGRTLILPDGIDFRAMLMRQQRFKSYFIPILEQRLGE